MRITRLLARMTTFVLASVLVGGLAFAASGFVGKYKTTDTEGKDFTIWLSDDGVAKGDMADKGLAGMWKEEGNAAVITWDTGWTTTITKDGDSYTKTAEKDGKPVGSPAKAEKTE
jgi:hypothetical protein